MENKYIELNDDDLELVAGGAAFVNANTSKVAFNAAKRVFSFKNCTYKDVRNLCEDLIGQYDTELEFDNACIAALQAKGWI